MSTFNFSYQPTSVEMVNKTLSQTFFLLSIMLVITSVASFFSLNMHLSLMGSLGLFIGSLVLIFVIGLTKNPFLALFGLFAFSLMEGMSLGPFINHYLALRNGTEIVATTTLTTAAITFGCAMYAIMSKKSFSYLGGFLMASTLGLLVLMLIGMFFHSTMFHLMISGAAALIFSIWILYDVSEIKNGNETNYIFGALNIYLDIINLFINLLPIIAQIMGGSSSDD